MCVCVCVCVCASMVWCYALHTDMTPAGMTVIAITVAVIIANYWATRGLGFQAWRAGDLWRNVCEGLFVSLWVCYCL